MNAVSAVRRVAALLQLLGLPAVALHAQQQQRQRLKALDRFKTHPHGVLVATDVAARGLDVPDVQVRGSVATGLMVAGGPGFWVCDRARVFSAGGPGFQASDVVGVVGGGCSLGFT